MNNGKLVNARDLPIIKLTPRTKRKINKKYHHRIEASIRAVGLIEPLVVYPLDGQYEILDGCLRYFILLEMGVETVPCLIGKEREAFTGNRMVNRLSSAQEMRMLRKSLEELDEKSIAEALGMSGIKHRLHQGLLKKLSPKVTRSFESGKITKSCATELAHVKPDRQEEIIELMESCDDHSVTLAKGMVLKTPANKRTKTQSQKTPWNRAAEKKNDLLKRLHEAEQQQEFYSGLYRQYTTNLLKLVIFVRSLVSNSRVNEYLQEHYPDQLQLFNEIIDSTEQ